MNFYSRYVSECNKIGKAPSKVALEIGLSKTAVNGWKTGKSKPTDATLMKIADYFGITVDELKGEKTAPTVSGERLEETPNYNVIKICGRDGSYSEKRLTDEELAAFAALFSRLPDASDDL